MQRQDRLIVVPEREGFKIGIDLSYLRLAINRIATAAATSGVIDTTS